MKKLTSRLSIGLVLSSVSIFPVSNMAQALGSRPTNYSDENNKTSLSIAVINDRNIYNFKHYSGDFSNPNTQISLAVNKSICQNTLGMVKSQLGLVKSAQIKQIGANSGKYPRGRAMVADLTIVNNNPRSENLINSSSKLLTVSQKIAKNCPNVSMVRFYIDQTDNGVVYGLINGRMKQFTCNNDTPIKWGEIICP